MGVATWRWVANDDTCGICRLAFENCCPDCKLPGDDCPLGNECSPFILLTITEDYKTYLFTVWGQCSHCYHMHCIMKWLNSQQVRQLCPMCRQEWKFKE